MAKPAPRRRRPTDGRRVRSAQTRQTIIEAYLDLLRATPRVPTATQIAKRAGCSTRSVFERFADLLTLSFAAADHVLEQAIAQAEAPDVDANRQARLRFQVETRARVCERWLPVWRALIRHQSESELLTGRMGRVYDLIVERLKLMYQPELSTLPEPERNQVLIALEALTDFEAWGRMRERHGLSVEAACEVWTKTIDRILPPTPAA